LAYRKLCCCGQGYFGISAVAPFWYNTAIALRYDDCGAQAPFCEEVAQSPKRVLNIDSSPQKWRAAVFMVITNFSYFGFKPLALQKMA
jgi:hypothetical protein